MATTFLIVRHGLTAWNREERFRGRTDLELDETGARQAEAAAARIALDYKPLAVYSSPLQRAMRTAGVIAGRLHLPVHADDGLLDLDYGDFTGLTGEEARLKFPYIYGTWLAAPHIMRFPHGESLDDVRLRVVDLTSRLSQEYPNGEVVLVSHIVVCRVLLSSLLGMHPGVFNTFQVDTASLSVVRLDESRRILVCANDSCHLRSIGDFAPSKPL